MDARIFFFWLFASLGVFTSLMVILQRNALSCAFFLILSFLNSAGLYVLLEAHFLAVAQVLVYAGAIMVLFIFVIMLLNMGAEEFKLFHFERTHVPALIVALLMLTGFLGMIRHGGIWQKASVTSPLVTVSETYGNIASVAQVMFTQYLVPFEITSILILVATVGAVLLAKRVI